MCSVGVLVTDVRAWVWPTQSGDRDRFHVLTHELLEVICDLAKDHVLVVDFCKQIFDVIHKSLAK